MCSWYDILCGRHTVQLAPAVLTVMGTRNTQTGGKVRKDRLCRTGDCPALLSLIPTCGAIWWAQLTAEWALVFDWSSCYNICHTPGIIPLLEICDIRGLTYTVKTNGQHFQQVLWLFCQFLWWSRWNLVQLINRYDPKHSVCLICSPCASCSCKASIYL